ncbi:hypothetical protein DVW02_04175, partial [Clostridium botulinum]|nr:hypothetical protein [Clostridium botulinum]
YNFNGSPQIVANTEMTKLIVINGAVCIFYLKVSESNTREIYYEFRNINNVLLGSNPNGKYMDLRSIYGIL